MRIKTSQSKNQGSVLLVTLCTAWVIGIALVSYLTLVANQNRTTYHSQSWSGCIPVLEAGIEEALTQLNYNNGEGVTNAASHGWTLMTNGYYFKSQIVGPATDGTYYEVTIDPNTNGTPATPIIISQGYVPAPGNTGAPMGGDTAFGMILGTVSGQSTPAMISRTVKVGTLFQMSGGGKGGINTKGTINFAGGWLDSFDSSDTNSFPGGKYVFANRKANGQAVSNSSATPAISVGTGHIYGSVTTGPGAGTVTVGSGAVGDVAYNANPTGTHIQNTHQTGDANLQFDDVTVPFLFGSGSNPEFSPARQIGGTNYTVVLDYAVNSKFNYSTITLNSTQRMVVTGGEVTLYLSGNFVINGGATPAFVYVAPGASLKVYVTGTTSVAGGGIVNGTGLARNLSVYGLGTAATTWPISGSSAFIGTVYAPYALLNFSGAAGASGSFSANRVALSGGAAIHYDESLSAGTDPQYIASSWNEI